jgi:hypothetical protein
MPTKTNRRTIPDSPRAEKMSRQAFLDLFPNRGKVGHTTKRATNKGYVPKVNPAYKAPPAKMSPAAWGRKMRKLRLLATKKGKKL